MKTAKKAKASCLFARTVVSPFAVLSMLFAASAAVASDGPPAKIHGQVLLPDGSPAADVPVIVHGRSLLAEARTGADGRFQLELDPEEVVRQSGAEYWRRAQVAAFADGLGPGWTLLGDVDAETPVRLRLVEDQPVSGRIVDQQGRPIAGATVRLLWLHDGGGDLDDFLRATRDTPSNMGLQRYTQEHMKYLNPGLIAWIDDRSDEPEYEVATDSEGRFELEGIGRERSVYVHMAGPGIATQLAYIVTRPEIDARWKRGSLSRETKLDLESGGTIPPVFPADFTFLAAPGRTIHGTLRDAATGDPVRTMGVSGDIRGTSSRGYDRDIEENGRYEIHGLALEGTLRIAALNTGAGPYLDARKELLITGDEDPNPVDFSLDRGVRVEGTVLDEHGNPVAGNVGYLAWPGNSHLQELSEPYDTFNTQAPDDEGNYAIVVPPGPGVLTFSARDRERYSPAEDEDFGFPLRVNGRRPIFLSQNFGLTWAAHFSVLKRIDPEKNSQALQVHLTVRSGRPVIGSLVTSEGDIIKAFRARGLTRGGFEGRRDGTFRVRGLKEGEERRVYFLSEDGDWAAVKEFTLADADRKQQVVELQRTGRIRGRILDADGKPLSEGVYAAGSRGILAAAGGGGRPVGMFEFAEGETDADGFFYMKGIPANVPLEVMAARRPETGKTLQPILVAEVTLRPGQDLDLGEVKLRQENPQDR